MNILRTSYMLHTGHIQGTYKVLPSLHLTGPLASMCIFFLFHASFVHHISCLQDIPTRNIFNLHHMIPIALHRPNSDFWSNPLPFLWSDCFLFFSSCVCSSFQNGILSWPWQCFHTTQHCLSAFCHCGIIPHSP